MKREDKFDFPDDWLKLTFDDVFLLINQKSFLKTRRNIDLSIQIKNLKLNLPILWANMSTVMDWNFAKYLALMWWMWVLHQNCEIQEQVDEVQKVKKYASPIISNPIVISENTTVKEIKEIFNEHAIGAVLITENNILKWIISKRDIASADWDYELAKDLMTNFENLHHIKSNNLNIDISQWEYNLKKSKVEQLPIINDKQELIWLFTRKWLDFYKTFPNASRDSNSNLVVAAAVWVNREPIKRASKLLEAGIDMLVLDTAHWYNARFLETLKELRNAFPDVLLAAWNIDNPDAAIEFAKAWADILKVWIWPWWACKTRVQTWFGKPQLSAIWDIRQALDANWYFDIKIIADWWIKQAWNLAKAISVWASFAMMWSIFAWTDKAVWQIRNIDGKLYKDYRWMASFKESLKANALTWIENDKYWPIFDEWADDIIPYKGDWSFFNIMREFHGSLASSFSYANANSIDDFYKKTRLGKQTISWNLEWSPWKFKN